MDREGFQKFLEERKLSEDGIATSMSVVEGYEEYLARTDGQKSLESSGRGDVQAYSVTMIEAGENTYDNYVALARYGLMIDNNELYLGVLELLDGAEALDNLYKKVGETVGETKRDEIFSGIELAPLGSPNTEKPIVMHAALERLESQVDEETCREILGSGLRDLQEEWYSEDKKRFAGSANIDEYLERKGQDFIAELEEIKKEDRLFFNQKITDEVIAYVDSNPEIRQGVREGNIIYEAKIPHMAIEYLAETDEDKKRYYYCHCPWVKESLKGGEVSISPAFCNCSAAFHKKSYEVIFGQPLEAEVVESVLQGDLWCKFAIHLPE